MCGRTHASRIAVWPAPRVQQDAGTLGLAVAARLRQRTRGLHEAKKQGRHTSRRGSALLCGLSTSPLSQSTSGTQEGVVSGRRETRDDRGRRSSAHVGLCAACADGVEDRRWVGAVRDQQPQALRMTRDGWPQSVPSGGTAETTAQPESCK